MELHGIKPNCYIDADSIDAYRALGLDAIIGVTRYFSLRKIFPAISATSFPGIKFYSFLKKEYYFFSNDLCDTDHNNSSYTFAIRLRQNNIYKIYFIDAQYNNTWKEMKFIQASFLGTTHFFGVNMKAHDFKLLCDRSITFSLVWFFLQAFQNGKFFCSRYHFRNFLINQSYYLFWER